MLFSENCIYCNKPLKITDVSWMDWAGWHIDCVDCKIQVLYCDPPAYFAIVNNTYLYKSLDCYKDTTLIFGHFFIEFIFNDSLYYFRIEIQDDSSILIGIYKFYPSAHVDRITIKEWEYNTVIPNGFINALKSKQDLKNFCQKLILIS